MDQLALSNGRPISVNEYPLPLKPIANDIRRVTQRRPFGLSSPAGNSEPVDRGARVTHQRAFSDNRDRSVRRSFRGNGIRSGNIFLASKRTLATYRFADNYPKFN